ncbi:MAG: DUF2007 domain-containing protein [Planctomycetaceae bacterium]|nr:DUF2007 domain-containing protein [Planctomycetaceae bacterium]
MSELVKVFSTTDASQAEIIKNTLQAEGIEAFVEGENQAGFAGVFEIEVVVPVEQEAAARAVLKE